MLYKSKVICIGWTTVYCNIHTYSQILNNIAVPIILTIPYYYTCKSSNK